MGALAQQIVEIGLLCATILGLIWVNMRMDRHGTSGYPLKRRRALLIMTVFGLVFIVAAKWNAPNTLSATDPDVIQSKHFNRAACRAALAQGDMDAAEQHTRNNKVSKARAKVSGARTQPTLDHLVRQLTNPVFFGAGCMIAVAPFLPLLVAHFLFPSRRLPADLWALVLPMVNAVMAATAVVFVWFHFIVDAGRAERCLLTSGHWYTYTVSTACCLYVLHHFASYRPQGLLTLWYVAWVGLYQAFALRVLTNTQKFHHDNDEAVDGILAGVKVLPIMALAAWLVDLRSRTTILSDADAVAQLVTAQAAPVPSVPPVVKHDVTAAVQPTTTTPSAPPAASIPSAPLVGVSEPPSSSSIPPPPPFGDIPAAPSFSSSSSSSSSSVPSAPPMDEPEAAPAPATGLAAELLAGRTGLRRSKVETTTKSGDANKRAPTKHAPSSSSGGVDIMAEMQRKMKERRGQLQPQASSADVNDWT